MIFNDTASSISYAGGTIAASDAHVWLEPLGSNNYTFAGTATATNDQTTSYRVGFRSFNAPLQEIWVDNYELHDAALAIPEPSIAVLGDLGLLALLRRRR